MKIYVAGRSARAVIVAIVFALSVSSCTPAPNKNEVGVARAVTQEGTDVAVSFPGHPELQAEIEPKRVTEETSLEGIESLEVSGIVDLTLSAGTFPATGATISFTRNTPIPGKGKSFIAHFDEESGLWDPIATSVSADRRTLTATIEHFSKYSIIDAVGDVWASLLNWDGEAQSKLFNGIGQLLGTHATQPQCEGDVPEWAAPTFMDHLNNPVLWCSGSASDNPDVLVIKAALNRNYAGFFRSAVIPEYSIDSEEIQSGTWINWQEFIHDEAAIAALLRSNDPAFSGWAPYPVSPLVTREFHFTKENILENWKEIDAGDGQLLALDTNVWLALAGIGFGLIEYGAVRDIPEGTATSVTKMFTWLSLVMQLNDCIATSVNPVEVEGGSNSWTTEKTEMTGAQLLTVVNCLSLPLNEAVPDKYLEFKNKLIDSDDLKRIRSATGKLINQVFRIVAVAEITVTAMNAAADLTPGQTDPRLSIFPGAGYHREFMDRLWTQYTTDDGKLTFDHPMEWAVTPRTAQSNDPDETSGVNLDVHDEDGRLVAEMRTGIIEGFGGSPDRHRYHELDRSESSLHNIAGNGEENHVKFEALELPDGWDAMVSVTGFNPGEGDDTRSMLFSSFGFTELSGGFFGRYISAEEQLPSVDPLLSGRKRLEAYMESYEYEALSRMLRSLKWAQ
ncbi:hypothetical protein [Arthrobacter sp. NPDC089319]|uniref:hypothetical protein n=1 Tax=Arthrobacter sp. NPDC089319 TaxID=3155915 RepID=UPI003438590F